MPPTTKSPADPRVALIKGPFAISLPTTLVIFKTELTALLSHNAFPASLAPQVAAPAITAPPGPKIGVATTPAAILIPHLVKPVVPEGIVFEILIAAPYSW